MKKNILLLVTLLSFAAGLRAQVSNLVGNWKLDNNLVDISGNGYTGTAPNGATYTASPIEGTNALVLNGSNQYIDLGNPSLFPVGTSARTISAWAKTTTVTNGYQWIFAYGTASASQAMFIGAGNNTLIGGSYTNDASFNSFWTVGVWHHICLTYDGTTAKLYADGVLKTSYVPSPSWNLAANKAYIGKQVNGNENWNGSIDDVRIYNKALSASEVSAIATPPPSVPTGLTATAASSSAINLAWNDNSGNESGFQIERSLSTGTGFSVIKTTLANATSYSDATLAAGTKYYYRILAVNSGGNLKYSSEANATTTGSIIIAPSNLAANVSALTTVDLTWTDNSPNETGFVVERAIGSGIYSTVTTTLANATTYSNTGLLENTTYTFRVRATNATGSSAPSNVIAATTSAVPPIAPTVLSAAVTGGTTVNLSWTDNSANETGFQVERSVTSGIGYTPFPVTAANTITYSDATPQEGTTYFYRVKAINNGGTSSYTSEVNVTTSVGGLVGQWKLNNNANDASGNNLTGTLANSPTFSTDSKEGAQSLVLNGTSQYVNLTNTANLAALPGGLSARTLCAWAKTTATDNTQRSIATWGINNTTNAMYIGQTGTSLVAGGFGDDFTVTNAWDGAWHHVCLTYNGTTAVLYFDGVQKASGTKSWSLNKTYAYIGRLFSDFENLWKGQIDDVRIYSKALTASEVQALITTIPSAPTNLVVATTNPSQINLSWTDNSTNETGFQIERLTTGSSYAVIYTTTPNATSYFDTAVIPGNTYSYRIKAINAGGNSTYTTEASILAPTSPPADQGQIWDAIEFAALKDLYNNLGGTGWRFKTNWPTTWPASATNAEFGTWFGVTVRNGDVVQLQFGNNSLAGAAPPSIGNLTSLTKLDLSDNAITAMPSSLANLRKLKYLGFIFSKLTSFPAEISSLTLLDSLDISNSAFLGGSIPASISNLSSLVYFNASSCALTGSIPDELTTLSNLQFLVLGENQFTGSIPSTIGNLTALRILNLASNKLTGTIPSSLWNLTNLEGLYIGYNNQMTGTISSDIGNMINLEALDLTDIGITGTLPSSIGNLSNLSILTLVSTQLRGGIPVEICNLSNLTRLDLGGTAIGGTIPDNLGNLQNLTRLSLAGCRMTGVIPSSFSNLINLNYFSLDGNPLSGNLPDLSRLTKLTYFSMYNDYVSGDASFIGSWKKVTWINLSNNYITSISDSVLNLPNITELQINNGELTSIPNFANQINKSKLMLNIVNNRLDFSQLEPLYNAGIKKVGCVPQKTIHDFVTVGYATTGSLVVQARNPGQHSTIVWEKQQPDGSWLNVNTLNQDATQKTFTRTTPASTDDGVYRWSMINTLVTGFTLQSDPITVSNQGTVGDQDEFNALKDLYQSTRGTSWINNTNWPTGTWPTSATSAQFGTWFGVGVENGDVTSIWMDGNNLIGPLPASFSNLKALKSISFRGNTLSGSFSTILPLTNLEYLDIYANQITGQLTEDFGNLQHLTFAYLGGNKLDGPIPSSIGNLSNLYFLALFNNHFTGTLPQSFYNLTNLQRLYIYDTQLEGSLSESFGNFTQLTDFWCYRTLLGGKLPESLGRCTSLTNAYLYSNGFEGKLPESLGNCTSLVNLYLFSNKFEGPIPENWKHLVNLQNLWLHFTSISGDVPQWLGDFTNLVSLSIGDTKLTGSIPPSLKNLTNLSTLYMERLTLPAAIPDLHTLQNLTVADLKLSHLKGEIPSWFMQLPVMRQFILNDNDLTKLPDFSSRTDKGALIINIENNTIPIDDIERYFTAPGVHPFSTFTYSPQKNVKLVSRIDVPTGGDLKIEAPSGGVHGSIVWERLVNGNWININSLNQSSQSYQFGISNITTDMAGTYRYTVTNNWVGMSFASGPITVEISDPLTANAGIKRLYNGLITSARWHTDKAYQTTETDYEGMYVYDYDEKYQLKDASWAEVNNSLDNFTMAANKFRTTGMQYDPNGNIQALHRYDQTGLRTNNFSYHYAANKNQLLSVDGYTSAYTYNALGQTIGVDKETGEDQYMDYDVTGKVTTVYSDLAKTQKRVEYLYDDRGFRLAKKIYDDTFKLTSTTWYIRDAIGNIMSIYDERNSDETDPDDHSKINLTEVPVYGSGKLGTYYPAQDGSTVYEITDHLGNVRALLRDNVNVYTATMEDNGQPEITNPRVYENGFFENIFETEKSPTGTWLNHTPVSSAVPNPNTAAYLDGTGERIIGPAMTLKVSAGDKFDLKAYGKFEESGSYSSTVPLASIISSLSGTYAFTQGLESMGAAAQAFTNGFAAIGMYGDNDDDRPRTFLNYILFDNQMNYVDSKFDQINPDDGFPHNQEHSVNFDELSLTVTIPKDGYIYIYLSNETPGTAVWFDDLTVTHTGVIVTQSTDYEAWGNVLREQKTNEEDYRFGYQGQFSEKDLETGWNHFELREFDPIVGRWNVVDPYGQYWSPYIGMGNEPIGGIDPNGGIGGPVNKISPVVEALVNDPEMQAYAGLRGTLLNEVVVAGAKWSMEDERNYRNVSNFARQIDEYNMFGRWLEKNMWTPKNGLAYFATGKNAVGPVLMTRNGQIDGWVTDPSELYVFDWRSGPGPSPKTMTEVLIRSVEIIKKVHEGMDKVEKVSEKTGLTNKINESKNFVDSVMHMTPISDDSTLIEAEPRNGNKSVYRRVKGFINDVSPNTYK